MFDVLPRQWIPVIARCAIDANPFSLEVAGERIVVFRGADEQWHALLDCCPHRGARLSLGKVMEDGSLRCGYHGWRFGGDGRCTRVPLNGLNNLALAKIRARALPTRDLAGAIWVYTGDTAPEEPTLPESLQGPSEQFAEIGGQFTYL